jgi:hypothetical protein
MTDDEWNATAAGRAMYSFEAFVFSIGLVMLVGGTIGGRVMSLIGQAMKAGLSPRRAGQLDPARDAAVPAALTVIATWSAFEGWVQDFAKGVMASDPSIMESQLIQERKYTMSDLLAPAEEKLDVVYRSIQASLGRKSGVDRYEDLFKILGLSASVPPIIKEKFYAAQMVRHVWVHNAGVADAQFSRKAPHLGYQEGQLVVVTLQQVSEYMSAIITYAMIVANRHRAIHGLGPLPMDDKPGETPIGKAYLGLYCPR